MCLDRLSNTRPDSDIGYKVMVKLDEGTYRSYWGRGDYRLNEEYYCQIQPDHTVPINSGRYIPGFHVYRLLEAARIDRGTEIDMVLVKVRGRNLLASGIQFAGFCEGITCMADCDVYEFMTVLEVIDVSDETDK